MNKSHVLVLLLLLLYGNINYGGKDLKIVYTLNKTKITYAQVGHVVGHALTSGGDKEQPQQQQAPPAQAPSYGDAPPPLYASPGQQMYAGELIRALHYFFLC